MELTVKVYNINKPESLEALKTCKTLEEYSLFVEEVRVQTDIDRENGFTNAVKACIKKGVLKDYLQRKSKEVINMLIAEYDYETDIAVQRAEEHRIAFSQGRNEGIIQGRNEGLRDTALALKRMGLEVSRIAQATGLSPQEIEQME